MATIKEKIKEIIYNSIPRNLKNFIKQKVFEEHEYFRYMNKSFSQEGEDLILSQIFYGINNGFFIDIGAHHPIHYSNTYKFYLSGWKGINIDAMPGCMKEFNKVRPKDINLEIAISNCNSHLQYFMFEQSGVNTFSNDMAKRMVKNGYTPLRSIEIQTIKMEEVFQKYLPENQPISFLSVDVEGYEMEVLRSNNWIDYRPKILLAESLKQNNKKMFENIFDQNNYILIAQTINNLFFADLQSDILLQGLSPEY